MQRKPEIIDLTQDQNPVDDLDLLGTFDDVADCFDLNLESLPPVDSSWSATNEQSHVVMEEFDDWDNWLDHDLDLSATMTTAQSRNSLEKREKNWEFIPYIRVNDDTRPEVNEILHPAKKHKKISAAELSSDLLNLCEKIIADPDYPHQPLPSTLIEWLKEKTVTASGSSCNVTPNEMDKIANLICTYKKKELLLLLWKESSMLRESIYKIPHDILYPFFSDMLRALRYKDILYDILHRAIDFIPWLKRENNKNLFDIFIINLQCKTPGISELIWENFAEVREWALTAQGDNRLQRILKNVIVLREKIFDELMKADSALTKLFISQPQETAIELLYGYATDNRLTKKKLLQFLNLITNPHVAETVATKLADPTLDIHSYVLHEVKSRQAQLTIPPKQDSKISEPKTKSTKELACSLKMFDTRKSDLGGEKFQTLKSTVAFTIDPEQKIFASIYRLISIGNDEYPHLSPLQLAWLKGKNVKFLGKTYLITDAELILLIEMLIAHRQATLFAKLWMSNARFTQQFKTWYGNCDDVKTLNMLLKELMFYPDNLFKTLIEKNTQLEVLFSSFPVEKKLELLFDYAVTRSSTNTYKFSSMLNLINDIELLKALQLKLQNSKTSVYPFAITGVKDAMNRLNQAHERMSLKRF